jgi:elongation factor Ts
LKYKSKRKKKFIKKNFFFSKLNCETDFVAKNEKFEKVLSSITNSIFKSLKSEKQKVDFNILKFCFSVNYSSFFLKEIVYKNDLLKLSSSDDTTRVIGDDLALAIGNLGENITLRRAAVFNVPEGQYLGWYLHGAGLYFRKFFVFKFNF